MLTNQNTTQENSKNCLRKRNKICKYISTIASIMLLMSILCINASAIVMQEITGTEAPYPTLIMDIESGSNIAGIEISGAGNEEFEDWNPITIDTNAGYLSYQKINEYKVETYSNVMLADYSTSNARITQLWNIKPLNINLWEWTRNYNDTIIWEIWDTSFEISNIVANYQIEIPYFNNSIIMGTQPLKIELEKNILGDLDPDEGRYVTYDLDLPNIETIIAKAIEVMENESQSNITFQYKGEELEENNYVTKVFAEDGTSINIDFKTALSTILASCYYTINGNCTHIGLLNYNDNIANEEVTNQRSEDFATYVIYNEFERSAEITNVRKDKDIGILNWLGNAISGIMNVEIFPNFSLGGLLSVIIMIPIILWILKLVAGG